MAAKSSFTARKLPGTPSGSVPLLIPNDMTYDSSDNKLKKIAGRERNGLSLVEEGLQLLKGIEHPLAVLAIGGPCRSGKSYLLSRFLGTPDAFALGHRFDPETAGVWIGTTVLACDQFTVVLMDTEGIDSVFAKTRDDACILVMTLLLSSFFIYNSLGVPHHSDLENMRYFANLASCIAVNSAMEETNAFYYKNHFPNFLWLLRDVHLVPTGSDGKMVTPTEYLVGTVLRRGSSFKPTTSDEVGRAILTFFPSIECKTLQPPSDNPETLQNIAQKQESLNPVFNREVDQLIQHVLKQLQPKQGFAGKLVDGPFLASLTEDYLKSINTSGAIPCITDTWNVAVKSRCEEVLKKLLEEYREELKSSIHQQGLPMEEDSPDDLRTMSDPHTLFGLHRNILLGKIQSLLKQVGHFVGTSNELYSRDNLIAELEHCTAVFEDVAEDRTSKGKPAKMKRVTGGELYNFAQENYSQSRYACIALFERLYQQIQEKLNSTTQYSFNDLISDLKELQLEYFRMAIGPAKWEVYDEKRDFIRSQEDSFRILKGFQQQTYEAIQQASEESARAAKLADEVSKMQVQMRNDAELNQNRMEAMQKEHQEEMERLCKEEAERAAQEHKKYEDFRAAHMQDMADMARENHEEMNLQSKRMTEVLNDIISQNKEEISVLNASVASLTTEIGKANTPTGPSLGEQLFQVGLKVLETGAMTAVASKCSLM